MLEQKSKSPARTRLAMYAACIFAVHVIAVMAFLMAGCKREQPAAPPPDTNAVLPTFDSTNVAAVDTNAPVAPTVAQPPVTPPPVAVPAAPSTTEYIVAKGDSFYSIGKKLGVSMKAIQDANPGVDSAKLKISQKLTIPAPSSSPLAPAGQLVVEAAAGSEQVYAVKSGDTLTKIAATHATTVKALRAANNLKTDKIKVGQKLKIPVKAAAPAPAAPVEPAPMPAMPAPAPVPAPVIPPAR